MTSTKTMLVAIPSRSHTRPSRHTVSCTRDPAVASASQDVNAARSHPSTRSAGFASNPGAHPPTASD